MRAPTRHRGRSRYPTRSRNAGAPAGTPTSSFDPLTSWTTDPVHGVWASDPLWVPPADGGAVSSWRNGGSVGGDLVQATGSARPTYDAVNPLYNGKPTVYFNADDALGVDVADIAQPVYLVVVGACAADGASRRIIGGVTSMGVTSAGAYLVQAGSNVLAGTATSDPHLWLGKLNGASSSITIDETLVASGNAGASALTFLSVGAYNNGSGAYSNFSVGDVALALVFTTDPTALPEWATFVAWVEDYYGVPFP